MILVHFDFLLNLNIAVHGACDVVLTREIECLISQIQSESAHAYASRYFIMLADATESTPDHNYRQQESSRKCFVWHACKYFC